METTTFSVKYDYSNLYEDVLDRLKDAVSQGEVDAGTMAVPFTLTCASALEARLNDRIFGDLWEVWFDDCWPIVEGYLAMPLKGKLNGVVPLLTENEYHINRDHPSYQALLNLIKQRNRIAHHKSFFEDVEVELEEVGPESEATHKFAFPEHFLAKMQDKTLGIMAGQRPFSYHDALQDLNNLFFKVYREDGFTGNDLIHPK